MAAIQFLAGGGSVLLSAQGLPSGASLKGTWVNLITGAQQPIAMQGNGPIALMSPWGDPAIAHLAR